MQRPIRIPCARHCRFRVRFQCSFLGRFPISFWGQVDEVSLDQLFAVTAPGVATYTAQELRQLGLLPAASAGRRAGRRSAQRAAQHGGERELQGGVTFDGDRTALYRADLHLRTANRILVRLGEFPAVGFAELRKRAARLPWERCLAPGQPVSLRVTCHKSRLYHSDAVAERVVGAIADRLGRPCKYDQVRRRRGRHPATVGGRAPAA